MAEISRARALERSFEQRAARARRARWLARTVLATAGMVLTLTLYLIPDAASRVVEWSHQSDVPDALRTLEKPADVFVKAMPNNVVPLRQGSGSFSN